MSIPVCTRCFSRMRISSTRLIVPATTSLLQTSSYHTSASLRAAPGQSGGGPKHKVYYRNLRQPSYSSKRKQDSRKRPAVGERRQQRTRIVLSNPNALDVKGLDDLSLRTFNDDKSVGRILSFDGQTIDQLRESRAFKRSQSWGLFRKPATLIRGENVQIGQWMAQSGTDSRRIVVSGEGSSGKSVLLAQTMAMAFLKGWVVINIPDAQEYTINHFAYAPLPKEAKQDAQLYTQSTLTAAILERTAKANAAVLSQLTPNNPPPKSLQIPSAQAKTLHGIASWGAENPAVAHDTFTYLLTELTGPGNATRPPLLFAVDSLDHWMGLTKYRDSEYNLIHAHQLTVVRTFLDLLFSGKQKLANGGIIMAATTESNSPATPGFDVLLKQIKALREGTKPTDESFPLPGPYQKVDSRTLGLLNPSAGTELLSLGGVSKAELASLMKYFVLSGILKEDVTPETVSEKWSVSGGGNVGEFCRWGERARIDPEKLVTRFGTNEGVKIGQGEHRPRARG